MLVQVGHDFVVNEAFDIIKTFVHIFIDKLFNTRESFVDTIKSLLTFFDVAIADIYVIRH